MEMTLFGIVESRHEAKQRAERMSLLISRIADAPEDRKTIRSQYNYLAYVISRAKSKKLNPNDHDGIIRNIGDLSGILSDEECADMNNNSRIWKHFTGHFKGWAGASHRYCTTLHPKEIAYLDSVRSGLVDDMRNIKDALRDYRHELATLRTLPDLPEDIAKRYYLTPQGFKLEKKRA